MEGFTLYQARESEQHGTRVEAEYTTKSPRRTPGQTSRLDAILAATTEYLTDLSQDQVIGAQGTHGSAQTCLWQWDDLIVALRVRLFHRQEVSLADAFERLFEYVGGQIKRGARDKPRQLQMMSLPAAAVRLADQRVVSQRAY